MAGLCTAKCACSYGESAVLSKRFAKHCRSGVISLCHEQLCHQFDFGTNPPQFPACRNPFGNPFLCCFLYASYFRIYQRLVLGRNENADRRVYGLAGAGHACTISALPEIALQNPFFIKLMVISRCLSMARIDDGRYNQEKFGKEELP